MCCSSCFIEANGNSVFRRLSRLLNSCMLTSENDVNDMMGTDWDGYKNIVWRAGLSCIFRARKAWWSHLQARKRSFASPKAQPEGLLRLHQA